jgi:methionyl-tRNA synthetase
VVPQPGPFTDEDSALLAHADGLLDKARAQFEVPAMHLALESIWLMLGAANRYFSAQEPWVLRKSGTTADQDRFGTVLYTTLEVVRVAALLIQPVLPESAAKLLDLLGQPADQREFSAIATRLAPGTPLPKPEGVFPRYVVE